MKKTILVTLALALVALMASTAMATAKGSSSKVKMKAKIVGAAGYDSIRGKARYESKTKSNGSVQARFRVQIERIKTIEKGTMLDVYLAGNDIGDMKVKSHREAKLDLRSKKGHTVPVPSVGDLVEVRLQDGTVVASGTF